MNEPSTAVRTQYDNATKLAAVERVLKGESKADVAKEIGCHVNVVRGWVKKHEEDPAVFTTGASASTAISSTAKRTGPAARASLLETLMAAHGIKVPDSAMIEKGAKALTNLPDAEIDLEQARVFAATVLSAVDI